MEKRNLEQRCAIKFCVKLNENATETCEKLKRAYGQHAVWRTQVFKWHKAFLDGRDSVQDEPRFGETCTSKTDENVQQPPYSPESMCLLPFPKTQIPPQTSFWNCGQHPKGRDTPAECTSTWRIPALLPGVGAIFQRCVASQGNYFEGDNVHL